MPSQIGCAMRNAVSAAAAMLKAIHAGEDLAAARENAIRVIENLRGLRPARAGELVEAITPRPVRWSRWRNARVWWKNENSEHHPSAIINTSSTPESDNSDQRAQRCRSTDDAP